MKVSKRCVLITWVIIVACLSAGCDVRNVDPVVKIGVVAPFDGELGYIGYDLLYSVRLAVHEINEKGGIGGQRVTAVIYSDSNDPVRAREVAEALVIDPAVIAVLGHWQDGTTEAAMPIYEAAGVAHIPMGTGRFGTSDPAILPLEFRQDYTAITYKSGRVPSVWAGTAYDAMQLLFETIAYTARVDGETTRDTIHAALPNLTIRGFTGDISATP